MATESHDEFCLNGGVFKVLLMGFLRVMQNAFPNLCTKFQLYMDFFEVRVVFSLSRFLIVISCYDLSHANSITCYCALGTNSPRTGFESFFKDLLLHVKVTAHTLGV